MSFDTNIVCLAGRLTRNPELKHIQKKDGGDLAVLDFDIANNIGKEQATLGYYTITVFGKIAENCNQYLFKGSMVIVTGKLSYSKWKNKEGQNRTKIKIMADKVQFISTGKKDGKQDESKPDNSNAGNSSTIDDMEDEIPF